MAINAGYMGLAEIAGAGKLRFSDASVSAKQEVQAPDLVMGDWDRDSFYYGPITIDGSMSGPIDERFAEDIMTWAIKRSDCGILDQQPLDLWYYCGDNDNSTLYSHALFPKILANSISVNASAGDVANYSIDFIGAAPDNTEPTYDDAAPTPLTETRKLVTWEKLGVKLTGNDGVTFASTPLISAFEFTVANNVQAVYSMGQTNLYPAALIPGIRQISGSVTLYNMPQDPNSVPKSWDEYGGYPGNTGTGQVEFTIGTLVIKVSCRWHRLNPTSNPGPITSTLAFTGIGHQDDPTTLWG